MSITIHSGRTMLLSAVTLGLFTLSPNDGGALANDAISTELRDLVQRQSAMLARQEQQLQAMQIRLNQLEERAANNGGPAQAAPAAPGRMNSQDQEAIADLQS